MHNMISIAEAPVGALSRIPAPCQVSNPKISNTINYHESLERRISTASLQPAAYQGPKGRGKLRASIPGLDRRMESPRARRSGVKSESCRSTMPERLSLRWVGRILGSTVSHEPSCPSRLHLLHHGASTQTTSPGASKDFGQAHS
jgi:hypothetical protein